MKYKVVKRSQPGVVGGGVYKYYASPLYAGRINLSGLSKKLSNGSTLTAADIIAVVTRLVTMIDAELAEGKVVELGDLGTFRLTLSSRGEDKAVNVSSYSIKSTKVLFKPSQEIKDKISSLSYEKGKDLKINPEEPDGTAEAAEAA